MEEVQEYKLYVGGLQKIPENVEFSYYNSMHKYFLVYANEKPEGEFIEVVDEVMQELDNNERKWLMGCKLSINIKAINNSSKEVSDSLTSFAEIFEEELKKEAEKLKNDKKE